MISTVADGEQDTHAGIGRRHPGSRCRFIGLAKMAASDAWRNWKAAAAEGYRGELVCEK